MVKMMKNKIPLILCVHDISGFGRCSLTVIIPIISACGCQVCCLPTAVLSTHTGNLGNFILKDLTNFIQASYNHYRELNLSFDCFYSGFLGSEKQIDICIDILSDFKEGLKIIDPVMADNGIIYKTYTKTMVEKICSLAKKADIITPNFTEACILLDIEYIKLGISLKKAKKLLTKLGEEYSPYIIITGVYLDSGDMVNLGYDRESGIYYIIKCNYIPISYPGTGDIFTSVIVSSILKGISFPSAMTRATRFVEKAIFNTYTQNTDTRYGVSFENVISYFFEQNDFKDFEEF